MSGLILYLLIGVFFWIGLAIEPENRPEDDAYGYPTKRAVHALQLAHVIFWWPTFMALHRHREGR